MSKRNLCEDDDATGGIGLLAYYTVGAIVNKFFFSGIVSLWAMEIWQANTPKIIAILELAATFFALKILSVDIRDIHILMKRLDLR